MSKQIVNTAKVALMFTVMILAGISVGFVLDFFESEYARDLATKAAWLMAVFTAGSLLVVLISAFGHNDNDASLTDGRR